MDVIYARGQATATDVLSLLPDPPSRTAVRTIMSILEGKGHLKHKQIGREYLYAPTRPRTRAGVAALQRVIDTFFEGSLDQALAAHFADPDVTLSAERVRTLTALIEQARRKAGS